MPEAADRIRPEPARSRAKPAAPPAAAGWARALKPKSKGAVAGAALGAIMIGIVVNAIALQHGRRVAPAPDPGPVAAAAPAPPPPAPAAPVAPRPSPTAVAASAPKSADAIADLLKVHGGDKRKLTMAAQNALAKLGFDVSPTGTIDADTRNALHKFAKKHGLPANAEITPKLVKTLTAAAAAN